MPGIIFSEITFWKCEKNLHKPSLQVIFIFFLFIQMSGGSQQAFAQSWKEEKSGHFIILYPPQESDQWAQEVLQAAEQYYQTIANQIGYARYQDFWTWNNRVSIVVYPDKDAFIQETGQPPWSKAGAIQHAQHGRQRMIVTFKQESMFLDGILPHEISHLMLHDFIGHDKNIPVWFDEGIAQLQEKETLSKANELMKMLVSRDQYIPFPALLNYDIRKETDPRNVAVFYAQSVSVTDFMIRSYGNYEFGILCRAMKNGRSFEQAIEATYVQAAPSMEELEKNG